MAGLHLNVVRMDVEMGKAESKPPETKQPKAARKGKTRMKKAG